MSWVTLYDRTSLPIAPRGGSDICQSICGVQPNTWVDANYGRRWRGRMSIILTPDRKAAGLPGSCLALWTSGVSLSSYPVRAGAPLFFTWSGIVLCFSMHSLVPGQASVRRSPGSTPTESVMAEAIRKHEADHGHVNVAYADLPCLDSPLDPIRRRLKSEGQALRRGLGTRSSHPAAKQVP